MERFDVIVIGQGYAGLTAARWATSRGMRTANFEANCMGGLILSINELDPVPAGSEHSGAELSSALAMSNDEQGVVAVSDTVTALEGSAGHWVVRTAGQSYGATHVVIASGARLRKLGVPGEAEYFGAGVSECADCDGPLYKGAETVVVGGGDSAFQEALALSRYASKVTLIMRGAGPRARAELRQKAATNEKLVQLTQTRVLEVLGVEGKGVEGVRVAAQGQGDQVLPCAGVFVFIGVQPNTQFLPADLPRDAQGALVTSELAVAPGLWAIGAARSGFGGLLTDAADDAQRAIAALS